MNYKRMQKTFQRLLNKYDQRNPKMKLQIRRGGTVDPLTGKFVAGTTVEQYLNGVVIQYQDNQIDGRDILRGDLRLVIDHLFRPTVGDYVIVDSLEYSVVSPIITHNPGGVIIGYECTLRR